jgi:hypothetical protein
MSNNKDATQPSAEPVAYQYRYADPFSGTPIWRDEPGTWNGQRPKESRALFLHPAPADEAVSHLQEIVDAWADGRLVDEIAIAAEYLAALPTPPPDTSAVPRELNHPHILSDEQLSTMRDISVRNGAGLNAFHASALFDHADALRALLGGEASNGRRTDPTRAQLQRQRISERAQNKATRRQRQQDVAMP